jgi:hypothetical protein
MKNKQIEEFKAKKVNLSRDLSVVASIEEFSDLGYRLFFSWWL